MKKLIALLLALMMMVTMVACGSKDSSSSNSDSGTISDSQSQSQSQSDSTPEIDPDRLAQIEGLSFELPEGWTTMAAMANTFVPADYPIDASSIMVLGMTSTGGALAEVTKENMKTQLETELGGLEVSMDAFESTKVDGYDALYIKISYELMGLSVVQYEYLIAGDMDYTVVFTDMTGEWADTFAASAKTITIAE